MIKFWSIDTRIATGGLVVWLLGFLVSRPGFRMLGIFRIRDHKCKFVIQGSRVLGF